MKAISIKLVLIAFLIALFQYPTNIYLGKFTVVLYLYVFLSLFAAMIGLGLYFATDITGETRKKVIKEKSVASDILEIVMLILFILNDMYACFFAYSFAVIFATILFRLLKNGNKEQ